jgi:predicted metalloendopeptidase
MRHWIGFLAVVLLAACPHSKPPKDEKPPVEELPAGGMSLADSGIVAEWLDRGADPCDDFFEYACGGFLDTAEIPPDRSSWSAIQVVVKRNEDFLHQVLDDAAADPQGDPVLQTIGDYYAACTDEPTIEAAGTKPLDPLLAIVGKVKNAKTAATAVIELHAAGIHPFFSIYPLQDFADATQVIAGLDQGGLGLPDRDYYVKDEGNMKDVRAAYRAHVGRMLTLLGWKQKDVDVAVADVIRIETGLAKMQQEEVARRDPHAIYHPIGRKGLVKAAKAFPWAAYFQKMGLGDVEALTVNDPAYFTGWVKVLGKEKPGALRNYMTWMVVHATADYLTKAFVDESFEMEKVLSGVKQLPPRWRTCEHQVDGDLGELLGQPYVAANFSAKAKQEAIDMTQAVFAAMDLELGVLPWMDDVTREAAKGKRARMDTLIGYPDKWREYPFTVTRTDFAANVLAASAFEQKRQLAKIGKPVDRSEWGMTPPTVNAYYDPTLNLIALPAGQLQPPFFGQGFHPAVNFGSTGGGTIGHEMTHGFDDEGSQFDADGNLRDWWSKSTKDEFGKATQCVVDQFAQYEAVPGVKLNGKLTAGENIADIGGVKLGFQAYQQWRGQQSTPPPAKVDSFTDDQLYFLAYGQSWCAKMTPEAAETRAHTDPHSPPRWRVNGVIIDQPGFATAFQCKAGSKMNPGNSCSVW